MSVALNSCAFVGGVLDVGQRETGDMDPQTLKS